MLSLFHPIQLLADHITHGLLKLEHKSLAAKALNFFIFDTIKIFILLAVIIFAVSFLRSFLPIDKIKLFLLNKNKFLGHIYAALFGILIPFCSCSAIPLFMGFLEANIPLGITISFLVSSPMINEVALALLFGLFGWKITLLYLFSGLFVAVVAGLYIGTFNEKNLLEDFKADTKYCSCSKKTDPKTVQQKLFFSFNYTKKILGQMWIYVFIGIGIGAFAHGYIPTDFLTNYAGADKWYAVPLATIIGIPLYSNAVGIMPLINALTTKGMAMGTALALMMSVTALSLPEFIILKRIMKLKLIFIFATIVGLGIMGIGFLFNFILK